MMATKLDVDIIKIINASIVQARLKDLDISVELSGGEEFYRKAISSVKRVGLWSMIVFPLAALASFFVMVPTYNNLGLQNQLWALLVMLSIIAIIPIILGYKLWTLRITPIFALACIITIAIFSLLFFAGVLPLIVFVLSVIALIRWSTYRNWFYDIDVDFYKEKAHANKTKK